MTRAARACTRNWAFGEAIATTCPCQMAMGQLWRHCELARDPACLWRLSGACLMGRYCTYVPSMPVSWAADTRTEYHNTGYAGPLECI